MRTIKFRAWNKKYGLSSTFGFGDINGDDGHEGYIQTYSTPSRITGYIEPYDIVSGKELLMQFTGLHDKNGKEIYEGDIVRLEETFYGRKLLKIKWLEECSAWNIYGSNRDIEIVGNIYENPDLIK